LWADQKNILEYIHIKTKQMKSKNLKHIQLFESFASKAFNTGDLVIGVLSEGLDVAVFSPDKGMEIMRHLNSLKSEYYTPFMIEIEKDLDFMSGDLYLFVDTNNGIKQAHNESGMDIDYPSVNANGVDLYIIDQYGLSLLGDDVDILKYTKSGEEGDDSEIGYAVELVGDDQYMEVQSWGQELKNGAYAHFMGFQSDEF
jgi:hypothetical protein